jgi:hypothetical protein
MTSLIAAIFSTVRKLSLSLQLSFVDFIAAFGVDQLQCLKSLAYNLY